MKKYFLYELKKYLWTLVILTAVCAIPYIVGVATMEMFYEYTTEYGTTVRYIQDSQITNVFIELLILLFVVPALVYSFKMTKRGVDGYYSLPIKREKLYFVATMVGLILVLVPFTVSFWGGFLTLALRAENPYNMSWYVPAYFAGVCFAIFLYGVNAFVYTRANRVVDGLVFMAAYAFIGFLANGCLSTMCEGMYDRTPEVFKSSAAASFLFGGGMFEFLLEITRLIMGRVPDFDSQYAGWWFGLPIFAGVVCYALLFFLLRYEKGENAEQNSESWFGYKTLIPAYVAMLFGCGIAEEIIGFVAVLVAGVVATIVYKRKFRLKLIDWAPLASGLVIGLVFALIG